MTTIARTSAKALRQRRTALTKANELRIARAHMRADMKDLDRRWGCYLAAGLLLDKPEVLHSLDIGEFLLWAPRFGKVEAKKLLNRQHISPWREIGQMTDRERGVIARELQLFADGGKRGVEW